MRDWKVDAYLTWDEWALGAMLNLSEAWLWIGIGPVNLLILTREVSLLTLTRETLTREWIKALDREAN